MLVLRSSPASPFGRKVKIAASLLGLSDRIRIEVADTLDPNEALRRQNPLGKIPTLVLENGETLYDSRVIVEYLDFMADGPKVIPEGWSRFEALRRQALADGIMDAALLQVYEGRFRPEERRDAGWLAHQAGKVERGLKALEDSIEASPNALTIGEIALACALGYLDLRFQGTWRAEHPRLAAWLEAFVAKVPAFGETRVAA